MTDQEPLYERMLRQARIDELPDNHPVVVTAQAFAEACATQDDAKKLIGTWARARKAWQQYTGEDFI